MVLWSAQLVYVHGVGILNMFHEVPGIGEPEGAVAALEVGGRWGPAPRGTLLDLALAGEPELAVVALVGDHQVQGGEHHPAVATYKHIWASVGLEGVEVYLLVHGAVPIAPLARLCALAPHLEGGVRVTFWTHFDSSFSVSSRINDIFQDSSLWVTSFNFDLFFFRI